MDIIDNYSDLVVKIELIKEQIKLNEWELEYWFGVKLDGSGIPFHSKGTLKFGTVTALTQADKKIDAINKLREQLRFYENAKSRMDVLINNLQGLDYKIAYRRIVYGLTHQEIAEELGYTEQYIRKRWMKIRGNKESTLPLENM